MAKFAVETINSGFRRPYADIVYDYRITSDAPESEVKDYCTKVVMPCGAEKHETTYPFQRYYEFIKLAAGRYAYTVTDPSCE